MGQYPSSGGPFILPEPSGGPDDAAINALVASKLWVKGREGSTYKLNSFPQVRTGGIFDMHGCTVRFTSAAVRTNMLRNAAVAPVVTATDVATVAGSSVITSPTLAAVAQVNQAVGVVGAGVPGGDGGSPIYLYGKVQSVNVGANQITLYGNQNGVAAHATLSGATGFLFNRDQTIEICGGTWDTGDSWLDPNVRSADWKLGNLFRLRRLDNFWIHDITLAGNNWTSGKGGVFGINPGDCTDGVIERIRGAGVGSVVQGDGPLSNITVRDIWGYSQDDLVAFGPVGASGNDVEGDITGVRVTGINPEGAWSAAKAFTGGGSNNAPRLCDVIFEEIHGNTQLAPVNVQDYPNANGAPMHVTVRNIDCTPGTSGGLAYPQVETVSKNVRRLLIDGITWPLPAAFPFASTQGQVHSGGAATDNLMELILKRVEARGSGAASICLYINTSDHNTGGYRTIEIDGYEQLDSGLTQQVIQIQNDPAPRNIDRVRVINWVKNGPGVIVYDNSTALIKTVEIVSGRHDANVAGSQFFVADVDSASPQIMLIIRDCYMKSPSNGVKTLVPMTVSLSGVEYDSAALFCTAQGTNGTARVLVAPNCRFVTSKVVVGPGAAQVVSCVSPLGGVGADLAKLTGKQDGDVCYNTNAATAAIGLYVYSAAGTLTGWKHLYSGGTV